MSRGAVPWALTALFATACLEIRQPVTPDADVRARIAADLEAFSASQELAPLLRAVRAYRENGHLFEAAQTLLRADGTPLADDPELQAEKAQVYLALGYPEAVVRELKACLREHPRQPDCLLGFARLLEADGTPGALREARNVFTLFLEHAPKDHPDRAQAEATLERLGGPVDPSAASAPLRLADRLPPEARTNPHANPHATAPNPHGAGGTPSASGEAPPLNAFGQALAKALQAVRARDFEAARSGFREALKLKPDHPSTMASLAETEWSLGERERALRTIDRAMALGPEDPQVRFMFGSILLRADERTDEAIAAWQSLLRDQPEIAEQLGIRERLAAVRRAGGSEQAARPGSAQPSDSAP